MIRPARITFLFLLTACSAAVLSGCGGESESPDKPAKSTSTTTSQTTPKVDDEELVETMLTKFYADWIDIVGERTIAEAATDNEDVLTAKMISTITATTDADSVLCAQDIPSAPVAIGDAAIATDDTGTTQAQVSVTETFGPLDQELIVSLVKDDGDWKIDSITCPA